MTRGKNQDLNKTSRSRGKVAESERTYRWGRRKGQPKPHPKLRQRAQQVRRRPWRAVAALGVILALVAGVVFLFGYSSVFDVEEVTVAGAEGEVADGAREVASTSVGQPLARVDTEVLAGQVQQDLRIASVDVRRQWPSGLSLDLTLREPALAINQSGTKGILLADGDGIVYDNVKQAPKGIPLVKVLIKGDDLDPAHLVALQGLRDSLPEDLQAKAKEVTLTANGDIQFLVGNIEVLWGDGSNAPLKGRALQGLLEQDGLDPDAEVPYAGPMRIDLSTPSTPVVTGLTPAPED